MVHHTTWPVPPHDTIERTGGRTSRPGCSATTSLSFRDVLRKANSAHDITFSAHATDRLRSRRITVTPQQQRQLRDALDAAAAKGARESLVLTDKLAMVVSVPNRTVITVARHEDLVDRVFTGIDSAVVLAAETKGK